MTAVQDAETNAVNLADEYADEAVSVPVTKPDITAIVSALLSIGQHLAALRETLNRELPLLREAIEANGE